MTFTVIWKTAVLNQLALLYVAESVESRERMAAGVAGFNARLAADPFDVGESRENDNARVAFPPLLCVTFEVDRTARVVRVTGVSRVGR